MQKRRYLEQSIKETFEKFGYKEIQTPTFETLELFTAKSGEGIIDELYSFTDKGGREIALRPELTAPVIRMYVEKLQMEPKPLKLFYFGNCFRYDRPQKGRYREFKQAGCEIIGSDTPEAYAELIAMAYKILKNAGLKNIQLNIGNLNILSSMFKNLKLSEDKQKYLIPLIDKALFEDVYDALTEFKINPKDATNFLEMLQTDDINKIIEYVKSDKSTLEEINKLKEILKILKNSFDVKDYNVKLSIVRGLDYYKGIVFEIEATNLGAEKQLCGGGAYELISLFGGKEFPTAGFAIGFDRSLIALETEKFVFPTQRIDAYVIPINEDTIEKSLEIANELRNNNLKADVDLMRRGVSKAMKYASSLNVKNAIIIGPDEIKNNSATVKDMDTGKQETVKIENLPKHIQG